MEKLDNIKKFRDWKNNWTSKDSLGLIEYISFNIHPDDVIILGNLFFPDFVEIEDSVFLSINFDEDIYTQLRLKSEYNKEDIEKTLNRIRVYDIFANCTDDVDEKVFEKVAELLRQSWSNHLKYKFPKRKFCVELIINEYEYGPLLLIFQV